MQQTDPVMILADELTKLVAARAREMGPVQQLVAVELTGRALLTALEHAHGAVGLNAIVIEAAHKKKQYAMMWPKNDHSPTVYDDYEPTPDTEPSPVVQLLGEEDETEP
jgi:hypothetical protein